MGWENYLEALSDVELVRYVVGQLEQAPETRHLHVQGYVEFKDPVRRGALAIQNWHPHCESRRGTRTQARKYCMKTESRLHGPLELGEWKSGGQGARNDLINFHEMIVALGVSHAAFELPGMYIRYNSGAHALENLARARLGNILRCEPTVTVLWGPTGSGKSRRANQTFAGEDYWCASPHANGNFYAAGYNSHLNVILDEFRGNWVTPSYFCRLLDRNPMQVNVLGRYTPWVPRKIVITSNIAPEFWWPNCDPFTRAAYMRRLTFIHQVLDNDAEFDIWADSVEGNPLHRLARSSIYNP